MTLLVELYLDEVWTDVTSYVRADPGVIINFGVRGEAGTADPAECTMFVNNVDGRFTQNNPEGAWYGLIKRGIPLRVTVDTFVRFLGEVSEFPPRWDPSGNNVWMPVTASGPLRRLLRGRRLPSPLVTGILGLSSAEELIGYWPMEDGVGSTTFASALDGPPGTLVGTPVLAADDPGPGSGPLPTFNAAGATFWTTSPSGTGFTVAFVLHVPDGGTADEAELIRFDTGPLTWVIRYNAPASLRLLAYAWSAGVATEVLNRVTTFGNVDGTPRLIKLEVANDGADVDWALTAFGLSFTETGTILGRQTTAPNFLAIGVGGLIDTDVSIGQLMVGNTDTTLFTLDFDAALRGYAGESVEDRMTRVAALADVAMSLDADGLDTTELGVQPDGTPLDIMRDAEQADTGGILRDALDVLNSITYVTRTARYNGAPALDLDYNAGHLSPPLEPTDDDQILANDVTANRPNGSSARAVDLTSSVSALPWPDGVGAYEKVLDVNVETDGQLPGAANWLLALGTLTDTRFPTVTVDLTKNPTLVADVEPIRPGHYITLSNLPAYSGADTAHLHVLGWTEHVTSHRRIITFNCTPAGPYNVGVYTDTGTVPESRYGTETSTLNEALDATETGVDVTTTGPVWTQDAAMFPFNILVGGEVMTATAISGSGAAQTFTVTRSVNGVVKTHALGAKVELADPVYYGL